MAAVGETHLVAIVPTGCLSSASSLRARARRRILMVSPTVCPVALNARLIVRTDKPCARDRARAQMFLKKVLLDEPVDGIAQRRSTPRPSSSSPPTTVASIGKLRRTCCVASRSQGMSGRVAVRSSRLTLRICKAVNARALARGPQLTASMWDAGLPPSRCHLQVSRGALRRHGQ